jgi:hypothetical protein
MTADQCNERAKACAINASLSADALVTQEFLRLAAQWRAIASGAFFLDSIENAFESSSQTARR